MNCNSLKLLAVFLMVIDHLGIVFEIPLFRVFGRLSFPIFAFLVVNGFNHTRSVKGYLIRLLLFAFISELSFDLFLFNKISFDCQNIFFTLFFGLLCISIYKNYYGKKRFFFILIILVISSILRVDYGFVGVLIVLFFYVFSSVYSRILFLSVLLYLSCGFYSLFGVLALVPICLYKENLYFNRKFNFLFYLFYPLHLYLLCFLKFL